MKFNKHHDIQEAEFDLTAMVDVVFLLIIFFMLSAQFARVQLRPVDLPQQPGDSAATALADGEKSLIVDMNVRGELSMVDMGAVTGEELVALIEKAKASAGGRVDGLDVVIRSDRACPARHLNRLAGVLARAGVKNWRLATAGSGRPVRPGAAGGGEGGGAP